MNLKPAAKNITATDQAEKFRENAQLRSDRLCTIDYLKGFAMFWITFVHLGAYWNDNSWVSLWRIIWLVLDWLGPSIFISITVIGTMISIRKKELAGNTKGMGIYAVKKFSYLFIVGEIMNLIIDVRNLKHVGPWHLLGMNMITAVAFAQLLVYAFIKLSQRQRVVLLGILVAGFPILFNYCAQGLNFNFDLMNNLGLEDMTTAPAIMYYLLFYIPAMIPTYCWLILMLATMITFNGFVEFKVKVTLLMTCSPSTWVKLKQWHAYHANRLFWTGAVMIIATIFAGGYALVDKPYASTYISLWHDDPFHVWNLAGVPLFLYRNNPYSIFYFLGILLMVFGAYYHWRDMHQVSRRGVTRIENLGRYSFTLFMFSTLFDLIPVRLSFMPFLALFLLIIAGIILAFQAWNDKAGGIGSLEWFEKKYLLALALLEQKVKESKGKI